MTFACRVKVLLEAGYSIALDDTYNMRLPFDRGDIFLALNKGVSHGSSHSLIVTAGGFALEEQAFQYGSLELISKMPTDAKMET